MLERELDVHCCSQQMAVSDSTLYAEVEGVEDFSEHFRPPAFKYFFGT